MKIAIGKKSLMKLGMWSSVILSLSLLGFFIFNFVLPTFAVVYPGSGPYRNDTGSLVPVWVNTSGADGKVDMFFVNGSNVYIVANISCSNPETNLEVCNRSTNASANFTEIGWLNSGGFRQGVYKTNSSSGSWVTFEFNATINLTNVQQIQAKMVSVNATVFNGTTITNLRAPVLVVNMSTFGCPPAGDTNVQFPAVPGWNISTGQQVTTPTKAY
ncbi:MAG: hypothetical protein HZC29_05790, partial [Thaumarchaeota archaeon]|nr:hypothetical protein [Nitrososphaerota archaeon]